VIAFAATMAACEAQCSVSTASLPEESMANAVVPDTKARSLGSRKPRSRDAFLSRV